MPIHLIPWLSAGLLSILQLVDDATFLRDTRVKAFSAGTGVVLLFLLPSLNAISGVPFMKIEYFAALIGFSLLHLILGSKQLSAPYRKIPGRQGFQALFFFAFYFSVGIVLNSIFVGSMPAELLFFAPVFLYTSSGFADGLNEYTLDNKLQQLVIVASILLGVSYASLFSVTLGAADAFLGLAVGILFRAAMHDLFEDRSATGTRYYILGIVLYTGVIMALINPL